MLFIDALFAFFIALFFALIFSHGCRRTGPWCGFIPFFVVLFFATWAGGLWLFPFGPAMFGVTWMPFLLFSLFVALLLAATPQPIPPTTKEQAVEQAKEEVAVEQTLNMFFWVIIIFLIIGIIGKYVINTM